MDCYGNVEAEKRYDIHPKKKVEILVNALYIDHLS